ncbi:hypothetical protein SAMN05428971_1229 [Candidatus Pantoea varia]|uniref:Uncharacterized protein n=1 Tax=Candidatus Pantoea varia TaxID=1881036 RepID=A0A1I4YJ76_9GAMM|nr:hypothetical protein SAMN05428971_1229 [Pantoea varia]
MSDKRGDFRSYIWPDRTGKISDKTGACGAVQKKQKSPLKGADSGRENHPCSIAFPLNNLAFAGGRRTLQNLFQSLAVNILLNHVTLALQAINQAQHNVFL